MEYGSEDDVEDDESSEEGDADWEEDKGGDATAGGNQTDGMVVDVDDDEMEEVGMDPQPPPQTREVEEDYDT